MSTNKFLYSSSEGLLKNLTVGNSHVIGMLEAEEELQNGCEKFGRCTGLFVNYYYQHRYLKTHFPLVKALSQYNLTAIEIGEISLDSLMLIMAAKVARVQVSNSIRVNLTYLLACFFGVRVLLTAFMSFIWFSLKSLLLINYNPISEGCSSIVVLNCNGSKRKIEQYCRSDLASFAVLYDDLRLDHPGIDSMVGNTRGVMQSITRRKRMLILSRVVTFKSLRKVTSEIRCLFNQSLFDVVFLEYLAKRMFAHSIQARVLEDILLNSDGCLSVISGSTNEPYAISLQKLCEKIKIDSICIPHGVSPGVKLPHGLFGDRYYCLSQSELRSLRRLYPDKSERFIFSGSFISKCMVVGSPHSTFSKNIVLFTDSRAVYRDQMIIDYLADFSGVFYIKFHPNDNATNYTLPENCKITHDFNFAISKSIAITRTSAVLLDALYNGSLSVSFQEQIQDRFDAAYMYPGVIEDGVLVIENRSDLYNYLRDCGA